MVPHRMLWFETALLQFSTVKLHACNVAAPPSAPSGEILFRLEFHSRDDKVGDLAHRTETLARKIEKIDFIATVFDAEEHARRGVEAGRTDPWYQFVGLEGLAIGIDHFGHSAPGEVLAEQLGLTGERIAAQITAWDSQRRAKTSA